MLWWITALGAGLAAWLAAAVLIGTLVGGRLRRLARTYPPAPATPATVQAAALLHRRLHPAGHLPSCAACRALADDLATIYGPHMIAHMPEPPPGPTDTPQPPNHPITAITTRSSCR